MEQPLSILVLRSREAHQQCATRQSRQHPHLPGLGQVAKAGRFIEHLVGYELWPVVCVWPGGSQVVGLPLAKRLAHTYSPLTPWQTKKLKEKWLYDYFYYNPGMFLED